MSDPKLKTKASDYNPKFGKLVGAFATNQVLEREGVWRTHPDSGIKVRIRRSTTPEYKRIVRKHYKPFAHLTRMDPKDEALVKAKAAAEGLVADWDIGSDLPCTEGNVLDAMKELPDFYDWVQGESDTFEHYRVERVEEDAGNLPLSSGGNETGEGTEPLRSSTAEPLVAQASQSLPESPS